MAYQRQETWNNPELAPLSRAEIAGAKLIGQSDEEFGKFQSQVKVLRQFLDAEAPKLVGAVSHLFTRLNSRIENVAFNQIPLDATAISSDYQEAQPRALARAANSVAPLKTFLQEGLQSKSTGIKKLETKEDLERIGTASDFFCGLFWEEVASVRERELEPGVSEKFRIMWDEKRAVCESRYGPREKLLEEKGWLIHSLRAKENSAGVNNGRWAFYMVYVESQREKEFLEAIGGPAVVDLEDYGEVVTSSYVDTFFKNQKVHSHQRLLNLVSAYKRLAAGEKTFYIPENYRAAFPKKQISKHNSLAFRGLVDTDVEDIPKALDKIFDELPRGPIDDELTSPPKPLSADEAWALIDAYARENADKPVSDYAKAVLGQIGEPSSLYTKPTVEIPPLPKKAPERWPSDSSKRKENPAEFATRVYRVWMDAGTVTWQDLKRLDPLLVSSLHNWLNYNQRKAEPVALPEGFKLLTVAQANDAWIERVRRGQEPLPSDPDELTRFALAIRYRDKPQSR